MVNKDIIELCRPEELELMVCGSKSLNFEDLELACQYVDGYTNESQTGKWLWEVIRELEEDEKKKFLQFVTGCDRAPINGLRSLPIYVGRQGEDSERLPTAHTCFNHLLIPEYSSKDKLRVKLLTAIQNAEGFGLY